ncbi:MAG: HD domain-containing protein [Eubacterium sp.]|nr:HD domain-containing protein [Eubacterium sp.]
MNIQGTIDAIGQADWQTMMYAGLLELSIILTVIYGAVWRKSFGIYYTLIFAFIPVTNLGYMLLSLANDENEALIAQKVIYLGGCFLIFFITMAVFEICNINIPKWLKIIMLYFCSELFMSVATTEFTGLFYKKVMLKKIEGITIFTKVYGPAHTVFLITIAAMFVMGVIAIFYSLFFKKNVSNKRIILLLLTETIAIAAFFGWKFLGIQYDFTAVAFVLIQLIFLFIIRRISLFNIRDTIIDSITLLGDEGFISFDKKLKYIGCIGIAADVFPELKKTQVDRKVKKNEFFKREFLPMLEDFKKKGRSVPRNVERWGEHRKTIYQLTVNPLYNGRKRSGYQIHIVDDTLDRMEIDGISRWNDALQERVDEKTRNLKIMHNNLIMSMATMVESRDNSTGGHIRRTSDCVRILIDEMKKDPECKIARNDKFCKNLIKAAPMHDLGKIAVPDEILQKPGRFTDEEFEKMKMHAAEGARIVHEILKDTEDEDFHKLAENVAHYHHERMDGSGYPEGLVGEKIPIEARIMAIADVYDALVSKRVYKDRMSFEKADGIIMESFGKHFDPGLEKYYIAARPRLEQYYKDLDDE